MIIFGAVCLGTQQCSYSQIVKYWAYINRVKEESWLLKYQYNFLFKTCTEMVGYINQSKQDDYLVS